MTPAPPPPLAVRLLTHFAGHNEPLVGDLLEEFEHRQSRAWLWRQVVAAGWTYHGQRSSSEQSLDLGLGSTPRSVPLPRTVNLSGIPNAGVGGLGVVALIVLTLLVQASALWVLLPGLVFGVLLGIVMVMRRRIHGLSGPAGPAHSSVLDGVSSIAHREPPNVLMNMSAVEVTGVGGLGLVAFSVYVALVIPELRGLMTVAAIGGALAGLWLVTRRRTRGLSNPNDPAPDSLFHGELGHGGTKDTCNLRFQI